MFFIGILTASWPSKSSFVWTEISSPCSPGFLCLKTIALRCTQYKFWHYAFLSLFLLFSSWLRLKFIFWWLRSCCCWSWIYYRFGAHKHKKTHMHIRPSHSSLVTLATLNIDMIDRPFAFTSIPFSSLSEKNSPYLARLASDLNYVMDWTKFWS